MVDRKRPIAQVSPDAVSIAILAAVACIAGSNVVAVRISNRELDPLWGAGLRFLLASLLLFAVVRLWRLPLPRGRALAGAVLYGALAFGAFFGLGYVGLVHVQAGTASLLLAATPLLTILLASLHRVERFRWRALLGATVVLGGIGVLAGSPQVVQAPVGAVLAILAAALCAAEAAILIKAFPSSHPIVTNAVGMLAGSLLLLGVSFALGESWRLPVRGDVRLAVLYLVLVGSFVLFVLYMAGVKRWTASGMSYQFVLMPLVAFALSAWLDGEPLTGAVVAGGALVLAGIYVGVLWRPPRRLASVRRNARDPSQR